MTIQQSDIDRLDDTINTMHDEAEHIRSSWGTDPSKMPAGIAERLDRLERGARTRARELEDLVAASNGGMDRQEALAARAAKVDEIRQAMRDGRAHVEDGSFRAAEFADVRRNRANPWRDLGDNITRMDSPTGLRARAQDVLEVVVGIPQSARNMLSELVDNRREPGAAELVIAASDPNYRTAFEKALKNPVTGHLSWTIDEQLAYQRTESARAALAVGTGANGGYLVPFTLDPTIVVQNSGAANPFRQLARHAETATNSWNGVASAGVSAQWLQENGVVADNTPTFTQLPIVPQKAAAWMFGSYEAIADTNIGDQLPDLLADAKNLLESAAFATGAGTGGVPKGIVTAATTSVTTAGVGAFALADVYALQQALPARARTGKKPAVVGNIAIINKARQFDTAGGSSYWTNLGEGSPAQLLGLQVAEASSMVATTTTGSKILVAGDFDKMQIVDRIGMTMIFEPLLQDQATGRPTGQGGWFVYWRVGSDVLDPAQFRVLTVQ